MVLFSGEKTCIGAAGSDTNPDFSQTTGAEPFVGGGRAVAVNALINVTAFKKNADIGPII